MSASFYDQLNNTASVSFKEIIDILDAFQITSGQGFAISRTKTLMDFLQKENVLTIRNFNNLDNKEIFSIYELANIYKNIDQYIDLATDCNFSLYFS